MRSLVSLPRPKYRFKGGSKGLSRQVSSLPNFVRIKTDQPFRLKINQLRRLGTNRFRPHTTYQLSALETFRVSIFPRPKVPWVSCIHWGLVIYRRTRINLNRQTVTPRYNFLTEKVQVQTSVLSYCLMYSLKVWFTEIRTSSIVFIHSTGTHSDIPDYPKQFGRTLRWTILSDPTNIWVLLPIFLFFFCVLFFFLFMVHNSYYTMLTLRVFDDHLYILVKPFEYPLWMTSTCMCIETRS